MFTKILIKITLDNVFLASKLPKSIVSYLHNLYSKLLKC